VPDHTPSRLGLGTAQFGLDYGITNLAGRVPEAEVGAIVALARDESVCVLDTAALYGVSEAVLGRTLGGWSGWRIVTKTPKFGDLNDAEAARQLFRRDFARSLASLSVASIYGLLVHEADDLFGPHAAMLWDELMRCRDEGLVGKIGVSVYTAQQIETLLDRFALDLIQLPFNAVDQRLARRGVLAELQRRGIEIHARSIFLQGLLLAPPHRIDMRFGRLRDAILSAQATWREAGLTPVEGALAAALRQSELSHVIVGVTSREQLRQILAAEKKASQLAGKFAIEPWAVDDDTVLNPADWKHLFADDPVASRRL
jgi:aryl-alcohol dehydrogenase-like predicted oxidoreductase